MLRAWFDLSTLFPLPLPSSSELTGCELAKMLLPEVSHLGFFTSPFILMSINISFSSSLMQRVSLPSLTYGRASLIAGISGRNFSLRNLVALLAMASGFWLPSHGSLDASWFLMAVAVAFNTNTIINQRELKGKN